MKKYKDYVFIFAFIFISETLSVEKPPLNSQICIDPFISTKDIQLLANNQSAFVLIKAMQAFEPPKALKPIGAENIEITSINEISRSLDQLYYYSYNYYISFPFYGQKMDIWLRIDKPRNLNDAPGNTEFLELFRQIFGNFPAQVLKNAFKYDDAAMITIDYTNRRKESSNGGIYSTLIGPVIFPLTHLNNGRSFTFFSSIQYTLQHEIGHAMAFQIYGTTRPDQKWYDAILSDGASVSDYGDTNSNEDFAEAVTLYLITDGGLYYPHITRKYTHRFAILDEHIGVTSDERRRMSEINDLFENKTNDLLRKFKLPISYPEIRYLRDDIIPNKKKIFLESEGRPSDENLAELLRDLWRNHPEHIEISALLANKIHILKRERGLKPDSAEVLLTRAILENLFWNDHIPEFIKDTIYALDTLSVSEMQRRLHILDQVYEAYISNHLLYEALGNPYRQEPFIISTTFEEILEEIK